jgi:hypothetical protein
MERKGKEGARKKKFARCSIFSNSVAKCKVPIHFIYFFFASSLVPHHLFIPLTLPWQLQWHKLYEVAINGDRRVTLSFSASFAYHDQHLPFAPLHFFLLDRLRWQRMSTPFSHYHWHFVPLASSPLCYSLAHYTRIVIPKQVLYIVCFLPHLDI